MTDMVVVAEGLRYPEGPIALDDGSVLVVEIEGGTLARCHPDGRVERIATTGGGPNGAAIGPDGACYVCNNGGDGWVARGEVRLPIFDPAAYSGGRIERVDLATGEVTVLHTACGEVALCAPNDLVFDSTGGFWFTDFGKHRGRTSDIGAVYYAPTGGGALREAIFPAFSPNGVALSPDETRLYFTETYTGRIFSYPLAGPGELAIAPDAYDARNLLYSAPGLRLFDSLAVDAAGNLHVACILEGGVSTVSPGGELLGFRPLPELVTTNIAFGGPERRTAFVTLATTGRLVRFEVETPGHPPAFSDRCTLGRAA